MKFSRILGAALATAVSVLPVAAHAQRDSNPNTVFSQYWFSKPVPLQGNMMEVLEKQTNLNITDIDQDSQSMEKTTTVKLTRGSGDAIVTCKFGRMQDPHSSKCTEKYSNTSPEYKTLPARYR